MPTIIRRSQAVVPFGVGAIVDFEDEAMMTAGLDAWPTLEDQDLSDDRLARRLRVARFILPPVPAEADQREPALPFVRFPYWHFCPRCRSLVRLVGTEPTRPQCRTAATPPQWRTPRTDGTGANIAQPDKAPCAELDERRRPRVLPVRFVVACTQGHIEDFPWEAWVHCKDQRVVDRAAQCPTGASRLWFYATAAGGLAGLVVECTSCGGKRNLLGATGPNGLSGFACGGARPWLGRNASETCNAVDPPEALQRGASNVYSPEVVSSVLIPPFSRLARQVIDVPNVWSLLMAQTENGQIPDGVIHAVATLKKVPEEDLRAAILDKLNAANRVDEDRTEEEYRYAEYQALSRGTPIDDDDLVTVPREARDYDPFFADLIDQVVLVEGLAETRALVGFSRLEGRGGPPARASLSRTPKDWLPAYRVKGEGIFIVFKRALISDWRRRLGTGLDELVRRAGSDRRILLASSPELVALHTLAHMLIARLTFEAGYGASSIRERIYSAPLASRTPMHGLLLYTAAGDADGTLGGLVRLGRPGRLEQLFVNALADARWCSADPVCRESLGQGIGSTNLAACHACCLLPETSCEMGNRLLDRLAVIGDGGSHERDGLFRALLDRT